MPERPSTAGTSPKLSPVVQKKLVVIPPVAQAMLRLIGFAIFLLSFVKQVQDHVLGSHQDAAHTWMEFLLEIAPFGVAIAVSVVIVAQPAAFACWMLEMFNRVTTRVISYIPSKKR